MLPDRGSAVLDLLTRYVFACGPAQRFVIRFFDRARDFGPEILALYPLAFPCCGLTAKFRIVDQQVEHPLKIRLVAAMKGEAGAFDHLIIFRNITGEDADAGRHGVKKSQGQSLNFRRQNEQSGIGEKFFEIASRDPGKKTNAVRFMTAQAFGVGIGMTRPSGEYQFHTAVEALESLDQQMAVLLRRKPA